MQVHHELSDHQMWFLLSPSYDKTYELNSRLRNYSIKSYIEFTDTMQICLVFLSFLCRSPPHLLYDLMRMVDEERTQIGTMKALGYTNLQIISKYIFYVTASPWAQSSGLLWVSLFSPPLLSILWQPHALNFNLWDKNPLWSLIIKSRFYLSKSLLS